MDEIFLSLAFLFSVAVNVVFAYIIYDKSKQIKTLHKNWDDIFHDNINNLFYECKRVSTKLVGSGFDCRYKNYYQGIIKTLLPNGTEKIIWKSEKDNLDYNDCSSICNHRLKILKKYYNIEE